jgi:hypothetical protein
MLNAKPLGWIEEFRGFGEATAHFLAVCLVFRSTAPPWSN